ncbi:MAG: hypothetical protein NVSMB13_17330 [Mycobacteriales bacterium]
MSSSSARLVFCGPAAATSLAAPALFAAGLLTHPEEPSKAGPLQHVLATHHGMWMLAHSLLLAGAVAGVVYALLAAYAAAQRGRGTVAAIGAGLTIVGMIFAAVVFSSSLAIASVGLVPAAIGTPVLDAFLHGGFASVIMIGMLFVPVGLITVAAGLRRSGVAGWATTAALAIGPALIVTPEPIPCLGMLLWLGGAVSCVRAVASYPEPAGEAVPAQRAGERVLIG